MMCQRIMHSLCMSSCHQGLDECTLDKLVLPPSIPPFSPFPAQVFFIRDGIKFPDMVHALKPNPKNHIQEDWRITDFFSHVPESLHMVRLLFRSAVRSGQNRYGRRQIGSAAAACTMLAG